MDAPVRSVQSIRERFESSSSSSSSSSALMRRSPPVSPGQPAVAVESEPESNHSGGSSESDHGSTASSSGGGGGSGGSGGGFQPHNRTSIKRSPAFRTGHKALDQPVPCFKKTPLRRTGPPLSPEPIVTVIVNNSINLGSNNNNNNNNNYSNEEDAYGVNNNHAKKPSLRRKPGVTRTSKPNLETIISVNGGNGGGGNGDSASARVDVLCSESDPLVEQALRAPLPAGPAPKKPPRTFQHDAFIMEQQQQRQQTDKTVNSSTTETEASPQRPARRKSSQQQQQQQQQRINRATNGQQPQYTMSRSKTEPFLLGRKKSKGPDEAPSVEDLRQSPLDEHVWNKDSRWLNPVQWNSFTPAAYGLASNNNKSGQSAISPPSRLYSSMLTIADNNHHQQQQQSPARKGSTGSTNGQHSSGIGSSSWHQAADSGQYQVRRMSCDFFDRRRTTGAFLDVNAPPPASLPLVVRTGMSHVYDEPSSNGDLHYMCSPIVEVADYNSWNVRRVASPADDSDDADSERDANKASQMVEDRKIYVRRVSSNVCDLKRAARTPLSPAHQQHYHHHHQQQQQQQQQQHNHQHANNQLAHQQANQAQTTGAGLYEIFLEVALYYDRNSQRHTPYIKSCYPSQASVPPGVELFCFPDSSHWPPPFHAAADPYTIVLTDSKGDRLYGYCRRVVPEGSQACIPITYCLLGRHRAAGFYNKVLNCLVSKHGVSVGQRTVLLECLHRQSFPNPGRFVELPGDASSGAGKVQRLLDGRLEDNDLRVLFERLNETVILNVLGTVLLERKLVFVSQNLAVLSLCVDAVQSMLYPFVWQHTLVPALPHSMTEISSAPTPFVLGMLSKNVDDWKAIQPDQGMLVDLDSGKVLHCVGDESTILPRRSVRKLTADWEVTVNITQQAESARNALYSESFLRMFVDLCGHYEQHVHSTDSGQKYFEKAVFVRNHSNSGVRDFLEWFTETAMFNLFIESRLRRDARPTLFEHKVLEHSMQIVRPNAQPILPNSKVLGKKIKTIGDKLREMNVFS